MKGPPIPTQDVSSPQSPQPLTRRQWLGLASVASVAVAAQSASAQTSPPPAGSPPPLPVNLASPPPHLTPNNGTHGARHYNIRDYGAKGDGVTLDTAAVQAAIDACAADQGGTVFVPAGNYVIGSVEMKSNIILHLTAAGRLVGTIDGKQYHAAEGVPLHGDSTLEDGNVGLIYAVKAENFIIEGPGIIDGQGSAFRSPAPGATPTAGISGSQRPYHLLLYQCKNFAVRNIQLIHSAFHSMRIVQCEFGWFTGILVNSRVIHNNDGFHFISCHHIHVSDCTIICQDDACALFGSCQWVTVTNCTFSTRWSIFRFGGGIAQNITVSNCLIYETYGCPIKMSCSPNSRFENIAFSNLVMNGVTGPISISLSQHHRRSGAGASPAPGASASLSASPVATPSAVAVASPAPTPEEAAPAANIPGVVRNISFDGIHAVVVKPQPLPDSFPANPYRAAETLSCLVLNAVDGGFLEDISFNDLHIIYPGGGTVAQGNQTVPQVAGEYFEIGIPPAYGIYARNVKGLTLSNVRIEMAAPDLRPAVIFDHVSDAALNGFAAQGAPGADSLMRFIDSTDVLMTATRVLTHSNVFLRVEGADTKNVIVDGGDLSKASTPLSIGDGARKANVNLRA